ncbi:MAG: zinc-binding dehydrogenase [Pseudomonadota bacterium]
MKSLILKNGGYAKEQPDNIVLKDMVPFVEYGDLPEPEPEKGEVKVKVSLASVNPSDEMFIQGLYGQSRVQGNGAGFEGVGEVVASGGGSYADQLVGKRIAFFGTPGKPGTWSEFSIAQAATAIPLMDGVRDEDGAAMIVNPLTALAMFDIVEQAKSESFIVSAGASQLCKLMIGKAKEKGFAPIALVRRDEQIELLKKHGAKHVLNVTSDTFLKDFAAISRAEKPRIFLDAVANQTSADVFAAMPNRARWIIYGVLDPTAPSLNQPGQLIFQSKQIEGFWLTRWMQESEPARVMAAIGEAQQKFASGEWQTDVTAIVPLSEAMERLPEELAKPNGKVFIKP